MGNWITQPMLLPPSVKVMTNWLTVPPRSNQSLLFFSVTTNSGSVRDSFETLAPHFGKKWLAKKISLFFTWGSSRSKFFFGLSVCRLNYLIGRSVEVGGAAWCYREINVLSMVQSDWGTNRSVTQPFFYWKKSESWMKEILFKLWTLDFHADFER